MLPTPSCGCRDLKKSPLSTVRYMKSCPMGTCDERMETLYANKRGGQVRERCSESGFFRLPDLYIAWRGSMAVSWIRGSCLISL